MKEVVKRLSILFLFCASSAFAYTQNSLVTQKKYEINQPITHFQVDTLVAKQSIQLPQVYSFDKLAIFCKFEEKVARKSNINMRFRLGSLDYVNYLEQKPNWQLSNSYTQ